MNNANDLRTPLKRARGLGSAKDGTGHFTWQRITAIAVALLGIYLQDQRKLEASMRTEKLAGMGRLSTAVAHEIRNPLSAISQANALLDEDITDPRLKRLTAMVSQNAKRLEKIVNDILNVARVQPYDQDHLVPDSAPP